MKQTYRRFCAVLLILCLLCGCAAEKEVTVISLPGEEKMAVEEQNAPEATPTAVRGKQGKKRTISSFKSACRKTLAVSRP